MSTPCKPNGFPNCENPKLVNYLTKLVDFCSQQYGVKNVVSYSEGKGYYLDGRHGRSYLHKAPVEVRRQILTDVIWSIRRRDSEKRLASFLAAETELMNSLTPRQHELVKQLKWGPYNDNW